MKLFAALVVLLPSLLPAGSPPFEQRKLAVIDAYAHPLENRDYGYGEIAARLWHKQDAGWCSQRLEQALSAPISGDMFWMFPVTAIAYLDQGQLSESARHALRAAWKTYMPYRGDTENHFLRLLHKSLSHVATLARPAWRAPGTRARRRKRTSRKPGSGSNPGSS